MEAARNGRLILVIFWITVPKLVVPEAAPRLPQPWKKPVLVSNSGYGCYARCLAKCVVEEAKGDEARKVREIGQKETGGLW